MNILEQILSFITSNYVMIIELISLWILLRLSAHAPKKTILFTRIAVAMLFLSSVLMYIERLLGESPPPLSPFRPILTFVIYLLQPFILIVIMQITAPVTSKKRIWLLAPLAVSVPLYATSQWTKLVCWFSEENTFQTGPLRYWPYIVFAFYVLVFVVQCFIYFKNYPLKDRMGLFYIVLCAAFGVLLYFARDYSSDYGAIFTAAILLYYLFLYIQMTKADPLTGLMNRQCYYRDLEVLKSKVSAVASVDMNDLKWFNDELGHDAGDEALKKVADSLSIHHSSQKIIYRVGGDEFVIFYFGKKEEEVVQDIAEMREELSKRDVVCAFGYQMLSNGRDINEALVAADKEMYTNKSELKAEVLRKGGKLHRRHDD